MTVYDKGLYTILGLSAVLCLVAIPLALRKVRPNVVYGYRTRATLSNEDVWYEANAHFGRGLIVASVCGDFAIWALWALKPLPPELFLPISLLVLVAPTAVAALSTARFVGTLAAGHDR
jgi:uncharacterized membrane protein